jgi:SsrA-binding protein
MADITINKRLLFDYEILEKYEAGIKLTGSEVKAVKMGQIDLKGSYVSLNFKANRYTPEAWLIGAHISAYQKSGYIQKHYNPLRQRKLLLNKKEINTLTGKLKQKGLTLLPLSVYTSTHRLIKITLVLVKGKRKFDKRESLKKRDFERRKQKLVYS